MRFITKVIKLVQENVINLCITDVEWQYYSYIIMKLYVT